MIMPREDDIVRLLVSCRDRHGIVAAVSTALAEVGANIVSSAQHSTDPENGMFFLRMEFHLGDFASQRARVEERLRKVAGSFDMTWSVAAASERKRVAIFVSKQDHCLADLLWRWQRDELKMDLVAVVSNHPDHEATVRAFGVPYHHIPVGRDDKTRAERAALDLVAGRIDLAVLARYMQILSPFFLAEIGAPVVNIHHSFLPAFAGGNPYARAHERGVKLIGATAHYATEDLDKGPIIEQDVIRVTHQHAADELALLGRDVERVVLARAVRWHLEDRVLVDGNRTVVFSA
jgi:formyltetrahydrofolate deformylase